MIFTPYSLITAILVSAAVIVALNAYLSLVHYETMFSPTALAVVLFIPLLRIFVPIEFPFTKVIRFYEFLPVVSEAMTRPLFAIIPGRSVNLFHLLVFVWAVGFLYSVWMVFWRCHRFSGCFSVLLPVLDHRIPDIISDYFSAKHLKPRPVRVLQTTAISVPMIIGIVKPTIVLPDLEFTDQQLTDIIGHELGHCVYGDLFMKRVLGVLSSFYWWFPIVNKCWDWIDSVMEIRADRDIMRGRSPEEREEYISTLQYVIQSRTTESIRDAAVASLTFGSKKVMERRYNAIRSTQDPRYQTLLTALFATIVVSTFLVSYCFVMQPAISADVLYHEDGVRITYLVPESGNYLVARDDGYYDLYLDSNYVGFVKNMEEAEEFANFPILHDEKEETP